MQEKEDVEYSFLRFVYFKEGVLLQNPADLGMGSLWFLYRRGGDSP